MLELVSALIFPVFLLVAALLVLLAAVLLWRMWRDRRQESGRRVRQLDSVYTAQERRRRGE
jgi:membrane protein implicated in regulation of membrane protease activity